VERSGSTLCTQASEGTGALSIAGTAVAFLSNPVTAAVIGALVGASMLALNRAGVRFMTPDAPEIGAAKAVMLLIAGLAAALVGLLVYFVYLRAGLTAFGLGLVTGFTVPALVALFRMSGIPHVSVKGR
jgi:hypothetical protein